MKLIKDVYSFVEGNIKMLGDRLNILPAHEKEQVIYRSLICKNDCLALGYCRYCGCDVPGKLYVTKSCNDGELFPDIMNKEDWEKYKVENNIEINAK
jgi:hypothetical protein